MQFNLVPHPSAPPAEPPFKVWVSVDHPSLGATANLNIWYGIGAPLDRFVIREGEPGRTDELWRSTCVEAFLRRPGEEAYREWNFAPHGEWAAYDFIRYRESGGDVDTSPPYLRTEDNLTWWTIGATIAAAAGPWELGLSAVLEEKDGTKSYWALAHPEGGKPDFHAPVCFAARLP